MSIRPVGGVHLKLTMCINGDPDGVTKPPTLQVFKVILTICWCYDSQKEQSEPTSVYRAAIYDFVAIYFQHVSIKSITYGDEGFQQRPLSDSEGLRLQLSINDAYLQV